MSPTKLHLNLLAALAALLALGAAGARADFVTNFAGANPTLLAVGSDNDSQGKIAQQFTTGPGAPGDLASLVFRFREQGTAANDLSVSLYAADGSGSFPGTLLGTLTGAQPDGPLATYSYTPTSTITLAANTSYWAVLSSTYSTSGPNGLTTALALDSSETGTSGWSLGDTYAFGVGTTWAFPDGSPSLPIAAVQMTVNTPEPGTAMMGGVLVLAIGGMVVRRRMAEKAA